MKNVVFFTPSLKIGGIERVLLTYAEGLSKKREYNITYLTCSKRNDFNIGSSKISFKDLGVSGFRYALFPMIRFLKKHKPEFVITANDNAMIVVLARFLSGSTCKIITSQHNYLNVEVGIRHRITLKYFYPHCDRIIAVSKGIGLMLINQFKLDSNKIKVIYNPIDILMIDSMSKEKMENFSSNDFILFIGRFEKVKNLPLLCNAFKKFSEVYQNIDLVLLGDGDKDSLNSLLQELNLNSKVHFVGKKSNPFPYIRKAKTIALSSSSEALPTVLIEALSLGKTVVSTPTYGAIDVLESGRLGYLSTSLEGIDDFANSLKSAIEKPMDEDFLKREIRQRFNLNETISQLESLLW